MGASTSNKKSIGRRRVAVNKHQSTSAAVDRSFSFETKADDHEFTEKADTGGERIGSYSYITPEGDRITVRYSAGKNGFVILNPEEVLPQPTFKNFINILILLNSSQSVQTHSQIIV